MRNIPYLDIEGENVLYKVTGPGGTFVGPPSGHVWYKFGDAT